VKEIYAKIRFKGEKAETDLTRKRLCNNIFQVKGEKAETDFT
jgi:hypothetical protein